MSIEDALYTRLSGYSALSALVGTRIGPLLLPQNQTFPAVTYQRIGDSERVRASGADPGIVATRFRFSCWGDGKDGADGYGDSKSVAAQVRAALNRYGATVGGVVIDQIFIEGEYDDYEPTTEIYRTIVEVLVWHRE